MHSRIFQVSAKPIPQEDLIEEYRYEDGFVGSHADYVSQVTNGSEDYLSDLSWLQTATEGLEVDIEKRTVTIKSKKEYFDKKHDQFKELLEKLQDITLEEFAGTKNHFDIYDLESAYEDKYSFYIDDNDEYCGLTNLDNWVRNAEENKPYHIGSIFDYHF
jgi:hypothetical protein